MEKLLLLIFLINFPNFCKQESIPDLVEKNYLLTKSDFFRTYKFFPKFIDDAEHEIYIQIKSLNNNGYIKVCSGYFLTAKDENIFFDYAINDFVNCQRMFDANINNYVEFNIYDSYKSSDIMSNNGYFYVTIYIDRLTGSDFSGTFMLFVTNNEIKVSLDELSKYFIFSNEYKTKNFTFTVPFNNKIKGDLHVQIALSDEQNFFDLNITDENNDDIDKKDSISSYNNFIVSSVELNTYYIKLNFSKSNIKNPSFAIFFEYSTLSNNIMQIENNIYEINFLTKCEYYFLQNLTDNAENLFYIINDFSDLKENVELSYARINNSNISLNDISKINFSISVHKIFLNLYTIYNCKNNDVQALNTSNFLLIKLSGVGLPFLNLHKIQFKLLPRIIIPEDNVLSHYSFNSEFGIEKIGYFHIRRPKNESKRQLIYCSSDKTMNIYKGDYNIIEDASDYLISENSRLDKISEPSEPNTEIGYTVITYNEKNNYFVQVAEVSIEIYDNLYIENEKNKGSLNREVEINKPIHNYYLFYVNDKKNSDYDMILDVQITYGNISVEYVDINYIKESDFNLNDIISFNEKVKYKINAKHPILIRKTTELIKITNNFYNNSSLYQAKFYLNRYSNVLDNKIYNSLQPVFLKPLESRICTLVNIMGNTNYLFKIGSYYIYYINDTTKTIIEIKFSKSDINYNISIGKNFIKNNSYIYYNDTIEIKNVIDYPILIWCYLGINEEEKDNIIKMNLSQSYYYKEKINIEHKISFDWYKIKEKISSGFIPKRITILISNERQTKAKGYYYEKLNFANDQDDDYLLYYSRLNSISYELEQDQSHIFLNEDINMAVYDAQYFNDGQINFMIFPESGYISATCYIDYLYDTTVYLNQLQYVISDQSIYSLNLKLNGSNFIKEEEEDYSEQNIKSYYLVFQIFSRSSLKDSNMLLKINGSTFDFHNENNNSTFKEISSFNIYTYINIDNLNLNLSKDTFYINIIKPETSFFKYYLTTNLDKNYSFISDNYNIIAEKRKNSGGKVEISFDCLLKEAKTNYSILILNKNEIKSSISNEFDFFDFLYTQYNLNSFIFLNFIDNNGNKRIKKEVSLSISGNYNIIIMAQSLVSLSIYKYLGSKTFKYNAEAIDEETTDSDKNKPLIIILSVISSIIIIIIIVAIIIIVYNNKTKAKNNSSNISIENSISTKFNTSQNSIDKSNELSIFSNPIENQISLLEDKPIQVSNDSKIQNAEDNEHLSGQPPAPILGNTFFSEEDRINYELSKLNEPSDNNNNNNDDKKYVNTNMGVDNP